MSYEYAIVGGGVHGTHIAHRLVSETALRPDDIAILEPRGELLASFREKADACGMETLRSPFVHHLGVDPFGLQDFAEAREREDELRPTPGNPRRPSLDLFLDHARFAVEQSGIERSMIETAATGCSRLGDRLAIRTDRGVVQARRCILAIGHGGTIRHPDWARALPEDASITHVWNDPVPAGERDLPGRTCVIGGGVTAAHLAATLASQVPATLLSRHVLREAQVEADPRWINWRRMEQRLHTLSPGSAARTERVREAHRTGTVPPELLGRLERACERGDLTVRRGEVDSARASGAEVVLRLADGSVDRFSRVVCATGFGDISSHSLVEGVADSLALETGAAGFPVLDDRSLEWREAGGATGSGVFVAGALGAPTLGPLAGTIAGARRAADRLLDYHELPEEPIPAD